MAASEEAASGCTNMLAFLSTLAPLKEITILSDEDKIVFLDSKDELYEFGDLDGLRAQEESREAGSFIRFLSALPSSCSRLSFGSEVTLASEHELSALFDAIASPSCTLQSLNLGAPLTIISSSDSNYSSAKVCQSIIGDALCKNTSLTSLFISSRSHMDIIEKHLLPALTRPHSSIKSLEVWLDPHQHTLDCLLHIFTALALNYTASTLTHLEVNNSGSKQAINYSSDLITQLGKMLSTNKSLISFELYELYLPGTLVHSLFNSLESNVHLTRLSLWKCGGEDWPSASSVLDCLRVNAFLHELDLGDTPLAGQMEAAIRAQLERNKENAEHLQVLRTENTKQVQPTAVRLFLCGFPFSGKTTLASSLYESTLPWHSRPSRVKSYLSCATGSNTMLQRTRGIELRMLQKDKVKVSLWDLAGQAQYHSFHDNMFPNLSNEATPSLFLFVWNPIHLHESNGHEIQNHHGESVMKSLVKFKEEFRYWLKFIASKTLTSSKFKPRLLIAVTRADCLRSRQIHLQSGIKTWLEDTFNQCQEEFKEHIQFDMDGYFEMDARNPSQVKGLAQHIFQCAHDVLKSAPPVYKACEFSRRVIKELVHKKGGADPVITKEMFFLILQEKMHITSRAIQEAVALSLNDSGDIIYLQSSNHVVLDTQWFCHDIMGDLLFYHGSEYHTTENGFFSPKVIKELLESLLNSTSRVKYSKFRRSAFTSSTKIQGDTLVELLIGLRLACQKDSSSDIFIPASLCSKNPIQINPSQYLKGGDDIVTYMGRRLKCKDSIRTFFTPGIFHILQVTFHGMFSMIEVHLAEDIIAFSCDGMNVFVEFCKLHGEDHFIDILIHSCLNPDDTIEWVSKEVLNDMEKVCAQPRGIQGVELAYQVINPLWVQGINVCIEDKTKQAVPMEELRGILKHYLENKGFGHLKNALYTWQATKNSHSVIDLLGIVETLKVVESYQREFIIDVEDALGVNMEREISDPKEQEEKVFSSSISGKERKWIYDGVQEVRKDIQAMHQDIQKIKDNISSLCDRVVPKLQERMNELLTFAKEGEVGKLPRLFVLTRDDGVVRKIIATMVPGLQNVRLELLCEHKREPHLVDDQPGLSFATLEDGLLKRGLPYITTFLKVAQVAVKVGVHAVTGLGSIIPDFASIVSSIDATLQTPLNSRTNSQEGQQWLIDVLSKHNCCTSTRIHDMFGLSRVRYPDSQVKWLCDTHRSEGELCPL